MQAAFTGEYEYAVDDKGRLSIPARMRAFIDAEPSFLIVTPGRLGNLNAYTKAGYQRVLDALQEKTGAEASLVLREFTANSENCPMDKQGRIVLSSRLREAAGIEKEVAVIGVAEHLEIWDKKKRSVSKTENSKKVQDAMNNMDLPAGLF